MMIWNEHVKLLANFLNSLAIATAALGILAPIVHMLFRSDAQTNTQTNIDLLVWWGFGAAFLHVIAQSVLEDLREQ